MISNYELCLKNNEINESHNETVNLKKVYGRYLFFFEMINYITLFILNFLIIFIKKNFIFSK